MKKEPQQNLREYYARRAHEYEKIYAKPERQSELQSLRPLLRDLLAGQDVLELACGTGYWTQVASESARSILATDLSEEVLDVAMYKTYSRNNVIFRLADAFTLEGLSGDFTAGFAAFWWSHVPRQRLAGFLERFHARLVPGARVVFLDNNFVEGSNLPIVRRDEAGNTYQRRKLEDGGEWEVLKNFPAEDELRSAVEPVAEAVALTTLKYYWCLAYQLRRPEPG